jgi:beta-N-acetylglucosaminidase
MSSKTIVHHNNKNGGKPPVDLKTYQRNSSMSSMISRSQKQQFKGNNFLNKKKNSAEVISVEDRNNSLSDTSKSYLWNKLLSPQNPSLPEIKSNLLGGMGIGS